MESKCFPCQLTARRPCSCARAPDANFSCYYYVIIFIIIVIIIVIIIITIISSSSIISIIIIAGTEACRQLLLADS